ncbi:MAG: TIGR03118 family protein [Methanobacteriota archaeon]|nr:MAG: TIGR03118 family protein [Euryarchaeota archaeon]
MIRTSGSVSLGWKVVVVFALAVLAFSIAPASARSHAEDGDNGYAVTALVSSDGVPGTVVDPDLVNAWGLAASSTSPWWVADNHADVSTLYNAAGAKLGLTVAVAGGPTGLVFNGGTGFPVGPSNGAARFIFSTEGGTISGWNPSVGTTSQVTVDRSAAGAIYKGLAIANTATGAQIYATDFWNGHVDVFDGSWAAVTTQGGFMDRKIPAGYAPFGIQTIGDRIFVTFAKQGPTGDELHGPGFGFVDAFDSAGNLLVRVARHGALNAPWGLAMAPANFGRFGGDLLVGNFGDGKIIAYSEEDGHFERAGVLQDSAERPIVIDGLWALEFGHGAANNGPTDSLFFTAGPNDETTGLFGFIRAMPGEIEDDD